MLLLFSNTCSNQRALGRWYSTLTYQQNSSCVAQRAAACRAFIANPNTGTTSNQWSPFPVGFTQLIITNITGCAAISIGSMSNVYYYNYASLYNRTNVGKSSLYGELNLLFFLNQKFARIVLSWRLPVFSNCITILFAWSCLQSSNYEFICMF